jgi:hypothetical protein
VTRYRRLNLPDAGTDEREQADDEQSPAAGMLPPRTGSVPKQKPPERKNAEKSSLFLLTDRLFS